MAHTAVARTKPGLAHYRLAVASRALAAIGGGYVLATACAGALALALPPLGMARPDAVLTATMLAFVAHAVAAMWAFGCASAWRAWAGIAAPTLLAGLPVLWAKGVF